MYLGFAGEDMRNRSSGQIHSGLRTLVPSRLATAPHGCRNRQKSCKHIKWSHNFVDKFFLTRSQPVHVRTVQRLRVNPFGENGFVSFRWFALVPAPRFQLFDGKVRLIRSNLNYECLRSCVMHQLSVQCCIGWSLPGGLTTSNCRELLIFFCYLLWRIAIWIVVMVLISDQCSSSKVFRAETGAFWTLP